MINFKVICLICTALRFERQTVVIDKIFEHKDDCHCNRRASKCRSQTPCNNQFSVHRNSFYNLRVYTNIYDHTQPISWHYTFRVH